MNRKTTQKQVSGYLKLLAGLFLTLSCMVVHGQRFDWAKSIGSGKTDFGNAIATDGSGNMYVTGYFGDTTDFNPGGNGGLMIPVKGQDVFLAKYDAAGNFLWVKSMGGNSNDYGQGVALDGSGNVYVSGYYSSAAYFNPSGDSLKSIGGADVFLAKYDTAGTLIWAKTLGNTSGDLGYKVAVDRSGNVYLVGCFYKTAYFNGLGSGDTLTAVGTSQDAFVAKYDGTGRFLWANAISGSNSEYAYGVATDASGSVFVTGKFNGTTNFNSDRSGDTLMTAGNYDGFLVKYDSAGRFLWVNAMAGSAGDLGQDVAVDGRGDVYVAGTFTKTANFNRDGNSDTLSAGTGISSDAFLAKYDAAGRFLWVNGIGSSRSNDIGRGVAVDASGNVYTTGRFQDTVNFNRGGSGRTLIAKGVGGYLAKYDPAGGFLWVEGIGGIGSSVDWLGVVVDNRGHIFTTGYFSGTITVDSVSGTQLTPKGGIDMYIVKYGCSDTTSSYITTSVACGASYTFNGSVYTGEGIYTQVFPNLLGCDSTVTLNLTFIPMDKPVISVDRDSTFTLRSAGIYATYQWLEDDAVIPGATDSSYTVKANGNYRVVVTNEFGCSDTSDVYEITNYTEIADVHALATQIRVYPNPAAEVVYIQSPVQVDVMLTDIIGRTIGEKKNAHSISVKDLRGGIYLLQIRDQKGLLMRTVKMVKENLKY